MTIPAHIMQEAERLATVLTNSSLFWPNRDHIRPIDEKAGFERFATLLAQALNAREQAGRRAGLQDAFEAIWKRANDEQLDTGINSDYRKYQDAIRSLATPTEETK